MEKIYKIFFCFELVTSTMHILSHKLDSVIFGKI